LFLLIIAKTVFRTEFIIVILLHKDK
jgi:hypothetical protein